MGPLASHEGQPGDARAGAAPITRLQGPEGQGARTPAASPALVGSDLAHRTATACLSPWRAKGSTPTLGRLNYLRHISFFKHLKVKVIVAQPCLTFYKSMGCSPPGSSVHGILQARILEWVYHSFLLGVFPTQGSNLGLLHCRQILHPLSHQGSTKH